MARTRPQGHHHFIPPHVAGGNESSAMSHHHQHLSTDKGPLADKSWQQTAPWWWNQPSPTKPQPQNSRRKVWPFVVAGLTALALLTAFQHVVAQVVVQADRDRAASAVGLELASTCKLMYDPELRSLCLIDLSAEYRLRTSTVAPAPMVIAKSSGEEPLRD